MNSSGVDVDDELLLTFKSIYKEEFLRFCENTTIRGVPRIVKSRKSHVKYLWLTFFIIFVIGFVVCIIFLSFQYLEYNVIHPPRILSDTNSPFPSLTVCNFRPTSRNVHRILDQMRIKDPREFAHSINRYAIHHYAKKKQMDSYALASSSMNMAAYLESVPNGSYSKLGHKEEDLIIDCQITYMNGSNPKSMRCSQIGKWRLIIHAHYINCYSYNLDTNYSLITNTMEIYFYLDQGIPQEMCVDCFMTDVKTQLSGALILIHPWLTFPNFNRDIINLQPGTLTEIKLKIFRHKHKEPPYGRCSHKAPKTMIIYNDLYSYSEHACKYLTIQQDINKKCGCNVIENPIEKFNLSFCSNLPRFIANNYCHNNLQDKKCIRQLNEAVKRISCKANVSSQFEKDIILSCPLPCDVYAYESDRSTSNWPTKTWQMKWLSSTIAANLYSKPELNVYREAMNHYKRGNINKSFEILNKQNILEQNLLAVMINRPNYNLHLVEEKEVLSITSFLSQTGGLCSIWIGLSLISIVEVLEMILNVFPKFKERRIEKNKKKQLKISNRHEMPIYNQFWSNHEEKSDSITRNDSQ